MLQRVGMCEYNYYLYILEHAYTDSVLSCSIATYGIFFHYYLTEFWALTYTRYIINIIIYRFITIYYIGHNIRWGIFFLFCCCFVLINESKYCFNHLKRLTGKNDLLLLLYYYYYYYRCAFSRHCYYRFTFSWLEQMSISRRCANWRKHTYITIIIIHVYIIIYTCCPYRIE